MVGRLGLAAPTPAVGSVRPGEYPSKAVVGELVPFGAAVFREGHDAVCASVHLTRPDGTELPAIRMAPGAVGTDRWDASAVLDVEGPWTYRIEAWGDPITTWRHTVTVKVEAGQSATELANDLLSGAGLLDRLHKLVPRKAKPDVKKAAAALRDTTLTLERRLTAALSVPLELLGQEYPIREMITTGPTYEIFVARRRALYGSWYEFFPRSIGAELSVDPTTPARPVRHGTFKDATAHLDFVAAMGFDVVYLPPIHPIGQVNRKGPNNSLSAAAWDVGSPWAIGSSAGGHDAVHPDLGTLEDFTALVERAGELGMEVALDFALQAAPDHPWVTSHPEWFTTLPDGTIAYAENPPKKYQDIYPLNFDNDPAGLYAECLRLLRHWIGTGVRIFRVDNPHTKPLDFWQWIIAEVRAEHPDVLFLAEAFTTPAMMHELAKIGFSQSYTYYTWRNSAGELRAYVDELAGAADHMRPNFFVNTPDILHEYLQAGGPGAFRIRAVLAATLSPTWGVYSGFELFEDRAVRPGSEEYLDSEKYQLRPRDFAAAEAAGTSLVPLITRLNEIRRAHPALQWLRNVYFHHVEDPSVLCYSKRDHATGDVVLVVCATDPHNVHETWVHLDLPALGRTWDETFGAHDLLADETFHWGAANFVRLDADRPAHVFAIER